MKFAELSKVRQNQVLTEIIRNYMNNGETYKNAIICAKEYIKDIDGYFKLVDYSPYEDGTDIRVEW